MKIGDSEIRLEMGAAHPVLCMIVGKVNKARVDSGDTSALPHIEMSVTIDGFTETYVMDGQINMDRTSYNDAATYTTYWKGPSWFRS